MNSVKRKPQVSFTLQAHPFEVKVRVHLSKQSFRKGVKDKEIRETQEDDYPLGWTVREDNIIHIGLFDRSINTLMHELTHAVIMIYTELGMPINDDTSESVAFMMGILAEKAWKKISALEGKDDGLRELMKTPTTSKHLEKESNGNQS